MRVVRLISVLLAAVCLAACAPSDAGPASERSGYVADASVSSPSAVESTVSLPVVPLVDLGGRALAAASLLSRGAPALEYLEGPGLVLNTGGVVTELRTDVAGVLPDVPLQWAGCAPLCPSWTSRQLLAQLLVDFESPETVRGSLRRVGPGGASRDPRGEALSGLPALTAYREDGAQWRSWQVVFGSDGARVIAVVSEVGALSVN